jgi:uncharacterized membrane protein YoaK (UPF0700 family)
MLVREGSHRNELIDRRLATYLAAVAGALNAAAFSAVGFFSANMTGNVSSLSDQLATGHWGAGAFYASIVATFILGSATSTLMINAGRRRGVHRIYVYSIVTEAVLLALLGWIETLTTGQWHVPLEVLGLAFLMGLQNAVVTRISGARIRTTHVSGLATDIGIELATGFDMLRGREPSEDAAQNREKLALHLHTIIAFLLGGIVGVAAYRAIGGYLFIACATVLLWTALAGASPAPVGEAK